MSRFFSFMGRFIRFMPDTPSPRYAPGNSNIPTTHSPQNKKEDPQIARVSFSILTDVQLLRRFAA